MNRLFLGLLFISLFTLQGLAAAGGWGRTFAIEINSEEFSSPLIISDPLVVDSLSFWVGPGTGFSVFMGPVDHSKSIVDWSRGEVSEKPEGLNRYDVRFLLGSHDNPSAYVVAYEPDPTSKSGFIYFPAEGTGIVYHGVRETWRYASSKWNDVVGAAITEYAHENAID